MSFFKSLDYLDCVDSVEQFLKLRLEYLGQQQPQYSDRLIESMQYTLLSGGKRFRPVLCLLAAKALQLNTEYALPFASALEMIHSYSLIHDDLPCMDDDNERRGKPTNHKVYGEALALLAGDALLTEAFTLLADHYGPELPGLIKILGGAAGPGGMIGGQAMDMGFGQKIKSEMDLKQMHLGKTGRLISAAVEGAGLLAKVTAAEQEDLQKIGNQLGLAFQIKDDLLDKDKSEGSKNFIYFLHEEGTESLLAETSANCCALLSKYPGLANTIGQFLKVNSERSV